MIYVDDARLPFRRMIMSHMLADSNAELVRASMVLGLPHGSLQHEGTYKEHIDVSQSKRTYAIKHLGAMPITLHQLGMVIISRRNYDGI